MASIYDLKPQFQKLLRPTLAFLVENRFTPNTITIIALFGSICVGTAIAYNNTLLLLPVWLFIRMALNAIDGMMARGFNMSTKLGAILNELGDVISDIALYFPLIFVAPQATWPIIAFCFGAILTEFCGVLGQAIGATRHYEGPMGKSDRAFIVGLFSVIAVVYPNSISVWFWIFCVLTLFTFLTSINRLFKILEEFKKS